jgi:hypothetical protein
MLFDVVYGLRQVCVDMRELTAPGTAERFSASFQVVPLSTLKGYSSSVYHTKRLSKRCSAPPTSAASA